MKKKYFLFLLIITALNSNSQNYYLKTLNDNNSLLVHEAYRLICKTHDNNYMLTTYGVYNFSSYYLLFKIDPDGNVIWSKKFGPFAGEPAGILLAIDNGFIITGHSHDFGSNPGGGDMLIIKVDSSGLFQWAKNIRSAFGSDGTSVTRTQDSCYIVTGYATMDYTAMRREIPLIKIDNNGNVIYSKNFGMNQTDEYIYSIKTLHDYSYILSGKTFHPTNAIIIKIGSNDQIIWSKRYKNCDAREIIETNDNGFAFIGTTFDSITLNQNTIFVKLDSTGNVEYSKTIGNISGYHYGISLQQKDNGNYLISGVNFDDYSNTSYLHMIEINQIGDIVWSNNYFRYSISFGFYGPSFVIDGSNIYMGGILNDDAPINSFPFIFKLDTSGNSCIMSPFSFEVFSDSLQMDTIQLNKSIGDTLYDAIINYTSYTPNENVLCTTGLFENIYDNMNISIYPNPSNEIFCIDLEEKAQLEIINAQGQIIDSKSLTEKQNNLDLSNLVSGVYTLRIKTDRGIAIRKLIKQ